MCLTSTVLRRHLGCYGDQSLKDYPILASLKIGGQVPCKNFYKTIPGYPGVEDFYTRIATNIQTSTTQLSSNWLMPALPVI